MSIGANVLIVGTSSGEDRLAVLTKAGYRCSISPAGEDLQSVIAGRNPTVVLVAAARPEGYDVIRALKEGHASRHIPVAAIDLCPETSALRAGYEAGADDIFESDAEHIEVLARLAPLVRLSGMQAELRRRAATAADFGVSVDTEIGPSTPAGQFKLLVVGIGRDAFEAMCPMLSKTGISFVSEPDPYRARSRLENGNGGNFIGALVYMGGDAPRDQCDFFCQSVRNHRRWFDLPLFVVADESAFRDTGEAYARGASILARTPVDCNFVDVHLRLLHRGRALRRELGRRIASTLQARAADSLRSVYSEAFTRAHLQRLDSDMAESGSRSSAILFFIPTIREMEALYGDESALQLRQQMADWLSGLVRIEDLVARMDSDKFLMLLPRTSLDDAERVRRRVTGVMHQSEFRLADNLPVGVAVLIQSGLTRLEPGDTLERLVTRASVALA